MLSYLALGDSYTIGEQVPFEGNFPSQTVQLLRREGIAIADPVVIATTGWTTDELETGIREQQVKEQFDLVTLLIGVNNQYRGRELDNYKEEFTRLLEQAIRFARGRSEHVFVLSIPDWGVTPFAAGKDLPAIAAAIDAYNQAAAAIAGSYRVSFTYITDSTRQHGQDPAFLAEDRLHPSTQEYAVWAERLAAVILRQLGK